MPTPLPSSLLQVAKFGDAIVRVVALVVVALAVVLPLVVVLTVALFKTNSQEYAKAVLAGTGDISKTILGTDRGS